MQVCRTERDGRWQLIRIVIVNRLAAIIVLAAAIVAPSAAQSVRAHVLRHDGVSILVPAGWRPVGGLLTGSIEPREVLALARARHPLLLGSAAEHKGGLLLIEESGGARNEFENQSSFRLPASRTRFEGCGGSPSGPGYEFNFRAGGRNFEAFVYTSSRKVATEAVAALDTVSVSTVS